MSHILALKLIHIKRYCELAYSYSNRLADELAPHRQTPNYGQQPAMIGF